MRGHEGFITLAVLGVALVFMGSRAFDADGQFDPTRERPAAIRSDGDGRLVLSAGPGGHFFFEGQANGAPIRFMVDTGATVTALTRSDARAAGLDVSDRDFAYEVETANGTARVARGVLDSLVIGDVLIEDLAVTITADDKLGGSLFGVNGLNRFGRREASADELVLIAE